MDKKALAQQLLDGFGKTLTVGALTLDERTSSCVLIFDEQLVINIEYDEQTQRLVLSAPEIIIGKNIVKRGHQL